MALLRSLILLALAAFAHCTPPGFDESESGFIKVPDTVDSNLFYWLFKSVRL